MGTTTISRTVPADGTTTWTVLRDFDGLPAWHPAVEHSELDADGGHDRVGSIRTLTMSDGKVFRERLVALDDDRRDLVYDIVSSPLPVESYTARLEVRPGAGDAECVVTWSAEFTCDAEDEPWLTARFHDDVFGAGLQGLADTLQTGTLRTGRPTA